MKTTRWGLGLAVGIGVGAIGILGLGAGGHAPLELARAVFAQPDPAPAWVGRIAQVDQAIGRSDPSRAIYEWREAYGAAVKSGRAEGLVAVGDRAVRITELVGGSGYFLTE